MLLNPIVPLSPVTVNEILVVVWLVTQLMSDTCELVTFPVIVNPKVAGGVGVADGAGNGEELGGEREALGIDQGVGGGAGVGVGLGVGFGA